MKNGENRVTLGANLKDEHLFARGDAGVLDGAYYSLTANARSAAAFGACTSNVVHEKSKSF
jgi:hypothetical protein